jgi:hypothetical protein
MIYGKLTFFDTRVFLSWRETGKQTKKYIYCIGIGDLISSTVQSNSTQSECMYFRDQFVDMGRILF